MNKTYKLSGIIVAFILLMSCLTTIALAEDSYEAQERQMLDLINSERIDNGLGPLILNPVLTQVAREHSKEMIDMDYFSHDSYDGTHFSERIRSCGYPVYRIAENIAMNFPPDVLKAHNNLMSSPGHRANILSADYNEIGIGIWVGEYNSYQNTAMYTQNFGWDPDAEAEIPFSIKGFEPLLNTLSSEGDDQFFSVHASDICDVTWLVDGTVVRSNKGVTSSSFTMISPSQGSYEIKANAVSPRGSDSVIWSLEVISSVPTGAMKGDFDGNGVVDFYDFVEFAGAYNSRSSDANFLSVFDFDDNDIVDFYDFVEFAGLYNT
ncbi:CAP domain-containing protein [Methanolobus sp. WCC5]|uniref:CAP domain-containing protein n=1 Tax=Methanolobus sp. WCC5 TaxID=3125785 RepID=UPI00324C883F